MTLTKERSEISLNIINYIQLFFRIKQKMLQFG